MSSNIKDTLNSMTQTTNINQAAAPDNEAEQPQVPRSLRQSVEQSLTQYFNELDGQQTTALYELFMQQVEAPLFACVMQHTLFRKETRWPGYYYRGDAMKLDDENWHVLTVSRRDPETGEYTMEKAPVYHLVGKDT